MLSSFRNQDDWATAVWQCIIIIHITHRDRHPWRRSFPWNHNVGFFFTLSILLLSFCSWVFRESNPYPPPLINRRDFGVGTKRIAILTQSPEKYRVRKNFAGSKLSTGEQFVVESSLRRLTDRRQKRDQCYQPSLLSSSSSPRSFPRAGKIVRRVIDRSARGTLAHSARSRNYPTPGATTSAESNKWRSDLFSFMYLCIRQPTRRQRSIMPTTRAEGLRATKIFRLASKKKGSDRSYETSVKNKVQQ